MKTKTIGRLIVVVIILIAIIGGIFAYLYFGTDLLKSNEQLFLKYIGQIFDTENGFIDSQLIEYTNKKATGKYEDTGKFSIDTNIDEIDYDMIEKLQDFNITYSGKVDNTNSSSEQEITLNYSEDVNFPFKYKYTNETLGLQSEYVSSKYIGIENNNLKELIGKFGAEDTENFPDKIELLNNSKEQSTLDFTAEETEQLINTYGSILQEKLDGKEFTKNKENGVTSYSVTITNQEIMDLYRTILETVKNDQIIIPKLEEQFKDIIDTVNQINSEEYTVQNMIQDAINSIDSEEEEDKTITITVSQTDKKLSTISLKEHNAEQEREIETKIEKLDSQGNLTYNIEMNVTDIASGENTRYFLNANYQGLEQLETVQGTYQFGVTGNIDGQEQRYIYNLENTDVFNDGITIENYAEDEIQVINDYSAEEIITLLMTIIQRIDEVNTQQMEEINSEYGNPLIYAFPLTSSVGLLTYNQAADVVDESSMSELEMSSFNSQFTQYEGAQRGTTVKALLQSVMANNSWETDENRKVEVSGVVTIAKDDTEAPTDEINNSSTYNVEIQYTEGLVSAIVITEQ